MPPPLIVTGVLPVASMVRSWSRTSSPCVSVMPVVLDGMGQEDGVAVLGVGDGPAQRAVLVAMSALSGDRQRRGHPAVLKTLQEGRKVRRAVPGAGVVREDRTRWSDSQRVNDMVRISFSRSVCDTMKKPPFPCADPAPGRCRAGECPSSRLGPTGRFFNTRLEPQSHRGHGEEKGNTNSR